MRRKKAAILDMVPLHPTSLSDYGAPPVFIEVMAQRVRREHSVLNEGGQRLWLTGTRVALILILTNSRLSISLGAAGPNVYERSQQLLLLLPRALFGGTPGDEL
jgi:hypothetical protein